MDPIKILAIEHGFIISMLLVLEKINQKIIGKEQVSTKDINDGIIFLREFADKCHHGKEEDLFFPAMRKNNIKEEIELIDILIEEHKQGRSYIRNMADMILRKEEDNIKFSQLFIDNSKKYIELLKQHIIKENQILFAKARQSLSESQIKELKEGFEDVEKNKIGPEKNKELLGIINRLKEFFL